MRKKTAHTSGTGDIQVFELTMDNLEDQDELNRPLRKPGEPERSLLPKTRDGVGNEATAESTGKKKGHRKGKS